MGKPLDQVVVETVFKIFDVDGETSYTLCLLQMEKNCWLFL